MTEDAKLVNLLELPELLNLSEKLYPLVTDINDYDYWLLYGGRS